MNIVAIDPGKTCGVAWAQWSGFDVVDGFGSHEFDSALEAVGYVAEDLSWLTGSRTVVCESFVPRPGIRSWQPDALETIGALRYVCYRTNVPFETQAPADAKRFATNDKLAALGWRNPTPGGHADDAARHLLLAAVRHGVIDPARFTT